MWWVFTLSCLMAVVASARGQCLTADDTAVGAGREDRRELSAGQQAFSVALLQQLAATLPASNLFFSPYSTHQALLLAYFGAANQTDAALRRALRVPQQQSKAATWQAYRLEKFLRNFNTSDGHLFTSSNRVYISNKLKMRPCLAEKFDTELASIDYETNVEAAQKAINAWVSEQTHGQINNLIQGLSPASTVTLVNAAYFKGKWQSQFQPENTHKEVFHISHSKQALVEMMKQKGTFNYMISERLGAHVLELPYKGEDISMFILLPPFLKSNGVDAIIKQLDVDSLREITEQDAMYPQTVEVEIPKFTVESRIEMQQVFKALGAGDAFEKTADYSGFTGKPEVFFNSAIHQAKIEVNEEGTEAAAATAIFLFRSARPLNPTKFVCNHPFVYFLFDRVSQAVLFMGVYRSPKN
ncbi:serine protease inhibitor 88Ea-like [Schistocerca nitens]|uniref:serine protease inhibitor 88Ea-like n=1 Tax=Schistocerca nitens TaxID=7011 RepID=UPI002117DA93|nr:serine protease inhibitor 88Ea-like [Schistocerca nitens]